MSNCDYSITCNTNRSFFSQNKGMCQIRVTNMLPIQNNFLSLYYKRVTVCLQVSVEFRETY